MLTGNGVLALSSYDVPFPPPLLLTLNLTSVQLAMMASPTLVVDLEMRYMSRKHTKIAHFKKALV